MQILHTQRYLFGPRDQTGRQHDLLLLQYILQRAIRAELHDDAKDGRLCANPSVDRNFRLILGFLRVCFNDFLYSLEFDNVLMIELAQMFDVRLFQFFDFLHCHNLVL